MKNLNQIEVVLLADWIRQEAVGAQLQSIIHHEKGLGLELYFHKTMWMILDLSDTGPFCSIFHGQCPWSKSRKTKPLGLFLNSNAKNLDLNNVVVDTEYGRVLELHFATKPNSPEPRQCRLEFQMIPRRVNLIAESGKKSISWSKPSPLMKQSEVEAMMGPKASDLPLEARSLRTLHEEWLKSQVSVRSQGEKSMQVSSSAPGDAIRKQWQKDLLKKTKAITQIREQITDQESQSELLFKVGQELKSLPLDEVIKSYSFVKELRSDRGLSWNMENVFKKAKTLSQKKLGAEKRIEDVLSEIKKLEKRLSAERIDLPAFEKEQEAKQLFEISGDIKARKKILGPELIAFKGKSAKDNLLLLRSAKAWDYWFHLKDYPSSHTILRRNKNQIIKHEHIQEIAQWMAEDFLSKKKSLAGLSLDIIYAECRFVRPIKGDKIGRVQYHSENTIRVKLS